MSEVPVAIDQKVQLENKLPNSYLWLRKDKFRADIDKNKIPHIGQLDAEDIALGIVNFSNFIIQERPDTIILLDKSARPVAHLLKSLWREIYPEFHTPNICFVNIGKKKNSKYSDEDALAELYKTHSQNINGKKVIIADEVVVTGESISRSKEVIEKVFPSAKKLIFASVFGGQAPLWYGKELDIGVTDLWKTDDKSVDFISVPTRKVGEPFHDQDRINEIRFELSYLAKKIAGNCSKNPEKMSLVYKPNLPEWLDKRLNK